MTTSTTTPAITAQLRTVTLALACQLLSRRLGRYEAWAQVEATPSPWKVTRPGAGELLLDLGSVSIALTNHRRRRPAS